MGEDNGGESAMGRERTLKIVLASVGLLVSAGVYPLVGFLLLRPLRIQSCPSYSSGALTIETGMTYKSNLPAFTEIPLPCYHHLFTKQL
jgi:hypothetical protein